MPIYEYECSRCHQTTEALQKLSDPPLNDCPHCNGRLKKLMSLNSFHLKGNGWYVTDYAGRKPSSQADTSSSDSGTKVDKVSKTETSESSTKSATES
ncbi:MAG: zinc ribbon domain-containing protein [Deltaproteobacteria bacterium]|nr:MAG: zinc ribbon domain-containing protein [Deltaproteobacteria bacterium]